jgi:peptidoglycan/LPS O-acetylase OafA/YrhL
VRPAAVTRCFLDSCRAKAPVEASPKPHRARLEALPSLRFLAELQIIGFHYFTSTDDAWLNNFNSWGCCALTFFFLLSGGCSAAM